MKYRRILYKILQIKYSLLYYLYRSKVVINGVFIPNGFSLLNTNWGDDINMVLPYIISGRKVIPYSLLLGKIRRSVTNNILCVGSIIQWNTDANSIVWGAGLISDDSKILCKPKMVYAVRGPLTRKALLAKGIECPEVFGDPALLFPKFYLPKKEKKYRVGIIPHVVDKKSHLLSIAKDEHSVTIIDIQNYHKDWRYFIDRVLECDFIYSSSLHGLIISEAYHVPCQWVKFSDNIIGGDFKYKDFFFSINKLDSKPIIFAPWLLQENVVAKFKNNWKVGVIDLEKLINACPF